MLGQKLEIEAEWPNLHESYRQAIKASALGSTSTVSSLSSAVLYGAGAGQLLFGESGKVYSWNAATRSSTLRVEAAPNQVMVSGSSVYFVMGATQTVYRLVLP